MTFFIFVAAGIDFIGFFSVLEFEQPGIMCINISIMEDRLLEGEEAFSITLEITDENVILNTALATILIEDRVSGAPCKFLGAFCAIATTFKYRVCIAT